MVFILIKDWRSPLINFKSFFLNQVGNCEMLAVLWGHALQLQFFCLVIIIYTFVIIDIQFQREFDQSSR